MPKFTIERTYDVPHYRHVTYEAPDLETALKLDAANEDWENQEQDYDCSGAERVTGAWLSDTAYEGEALEVPSTSITAILEMEGGLIQCATVPPGVEIIVRDYDTEGTSCPEDLHTDSQGNQYLESRY